MWRLVLFRVRMSVLSVDFVVMSEMFWCMCERVMWGFDGVSY